MKVQIDYRYMVLISCDFVLYTEFPDKRQVRTKKEYWFHSGLDRKVTENVQKNCTFINRYNQFDTEIPVSCCGKRVVGGHT